MPTGKDNHAKRSSWAGLRRDLLRAELSGELSEFHALCFQAILAMAEDADCTDDYLEMAEAVAVTERELTIVAGIRTTRSRVQHLIVPAHSQMSGDKAAELWHGLLIALANLAPRSARIRRKK